MNQGKTYEEAWNETQIELVAAAEAHCRAFIVQTYYNVTSQLQNVSNELRKVLVHLMELYAVHIVLRCTGDLLRVRKIKFKWFMLIPTPCVFCRLYNIILSLLLFM